MLTQLANLDPSGKRNVGERFVPKAAIVDHTQRCPFAGRRPRLVEQTGVCSALVFTVYGPLTFELRRKRVGEGGG